MSDSDTQKPASSGKRDVAVVIIMIVVGLTAFFTYMEIRSDASRWEYYLAIAVLIAAGIPIIRFLTRRA